MSLARHIVPRAIRWNQAKFYGDPSPTGRALNSSFADRAMNNHIKVIFPFIAGWGITAGIFAFIGFSVTDDMVLESEFALPGQKALARENQARKKFHAALEEAKIESGLYDLTKQ
eukprot:TRINITY_DN7165_c0_g1_i1.p2 TRINITY_DN7165_c0_g1~~TRINITY_DN7165_c0_g1_i1.p2  ORF type:complete len:115 (+),score=36.01 TRINITY_DN7165_c0_g1_i1:83-427(+)